MYMNSAPTASLSREEFFERLDLQVASGKTLAEVGEPFGASRQQVYMWHTRKRKPNRLTLLLARYVWTFGPLPD